MAETTPPDPRIALLVEQDRRLALVGQGTMGMMLAAAENAGLIPASTREIQYGVETNPGTGVAICHSRERAVQLTDALTKENDGYTFAAVTRTHTVFTEITTDWAPLAPEENHD